MESHFKYIDENVNQIIEHPDNVFYIRPYDVGKKLALFAMVKEEEGVYRLLQLTKEQSRFTFPFEPLYWFGKEQGHLYYERNQDIIIDNNVSLNPTNLESFQSRRLEEAKILKVGIFATFYDGTCTLIQRKSEKDLQKKGGIQYYADLLGTNKENHSQQECYYTIECYNTGNNTFVIPELQNNKTLTKDNRILS